MSVFRSGPTALHGEVGLLPYMGKRVAFDMQLTVMLVNVTMLRKLSANDDSATMN